VRLDADFADEFPEGDVNSTAAYATLVRAGAAMLQELDRCIQGTFGIPHAAATALAVIEGADRPLTPSQISERVLVAAATMTATLDLLERRGWVVRRVNPVDRRSVLVEITVDGRAMADQLLPGIRVVERTVMAALTERERAQLLRLLAKVLAGAAEVAEAPPIPLRGPRNPPRRDA
jgi:DNA-binding MarR family transcriptional regulator